VAGGLPRRRRALRRYWKRAHEAEIYAKKVVARWCKVSPLFNEIGLLSNARLISNEKAL
jgi:hypothetical protein